MASIFGTLVDNSYLENIPTYASDLRKLRVEAALAMENDTNKNSTLQYVQRLWNCTGNNFATLCLVHNATGGFVQLGPIQNWNGQLGPGPYPTSIGNGQWGGYLHIGPTSGSIGAVVYRGKNLFGRECDWMLAWSNPVDRNTSRSVYTEIRDPFHYDNNPGCWTLIFNNLQTPRNEFTTEPWNGCISTVKINDHTCPIFEAELKLDTNACVRN